MRVKELLKERGITSKEFAKKIGMTEQGLSIALSENGNPPLSRLKIIASALNVPLSELFEQPRDNTFTCPNCGTKLEIKEK